MVQPGSSPLLLLAEQILHETKNLVEHLNQKSIAQPSLEVGAATELWSSHSTYLKAPRNDIEEARRAIFGLTKQLTKLLDGPHEFLHEYVSSNWDHGALYTLLEYDILEKIPLGSHSSVFELAEESGLPKNKLLCILRLSACEGIVKEVHNGIFAHTAISEELVKDPEFKAFIGFQLFETRVASVHLADSLKNEPNDYWMGQSAFHYAWGKPMYDWHRAHPEKASRFHLAMQGISQSGLDPARVLFHDWFSNRVDAADVHYHVIEVAGGRGQVSQFLAEKSPNLSFQVQDSSENLLRQGGESLSPLMQSRIDFRHHGLFDPQQLPEEVEENTVLTYIIYNILWNMSDEDVLRLLRSFIPVSQNRPEVKVLVNELVSPEAGSFAPHDEKIYRRRDVTLTTMHNVKQRTEAEWKELIHQASPSFIVNSTTAYTSHSCRCLLEVCWMS